MPSFNLDDYVARRGTDLHCRKCNKVLRSHAKYNIKRHYAIIHGEKFGEHGSFSGSVGKKNHYWRASGPSEFDIDSQFENSINEMELFALQPAGSTENPKEYVVIGDPPASVKASKDHVTKENQEISSNLKNPSQNVQSTPKDKETTPIADIGVQTFIKSYSLAISKGLEALPADVAIDFALDVLKQLSKKIRETKLEQNKETLETTLGQIEKDKNTNKKDISTDVVSEIFVKKEEPADSGEETDEILKLCIEGHNVKTEIGDLYDL